MKVTVFILFLFSTLYSAGTQRVVDLRGHWKFNIGDNMHWAETDYDDSGWEKIFVPSAWEDEGFNGYDGYAWYRRTITLTPEQKEKNLYLHLGFIDDVDEVYLNGHFIGFSGAFPPSYFTAYNLERNYRIPSEYLYTDRPNLIAIRVYDHELGGGILRGKIGIYEDTEIIVPDVNLEGLWKFRTGDEMSSVEPDTPDDQWKSVYVPSAWELQGFKDYDGFAWYRKTFKIPRSMEGEKLILLLGFIDDLDEAYLNGKWVGGTGKIGMGWGNLELSGEWQEFRAYELNDDFINFGGQNLLAVRVFDKYVQGGIYQGPVGIVRYGKYKSWLDRNKKDKKSLLDRLFDF